MNRTKQSLIALVLAAVGLGLSAPAAAQATRTWVSGVGDDVNPCSRTAPCKTFAGAISKTAAGGEINCLDPGGFGSVTIVKPIAILCDTTQGGLLSGTSGVVVNLAQPGQVLLSGLDIIGTSDGSGIVVKGTGTVVVRKTVIRMFRTGAGIDFQPSGVAKLVVLDSTISANKTGISVTGSVTAYVGDTSVVANENGLITAGGAKIVSLGNNIVAANGTDGAFTSTVPRK